MSQAALKCSVFFSPYIYFLLFCCINNGEFHKGLCQRGPAAFLYWNCYVTAPPIGPLQNSKFKLRTGLEDGAGVGRRRGGASAGGRGASPIYIQIVARSAGITKEYIILFSFFCSPPGLLRLRTRSPSEPANPKHPLGMNEHRAVFVDRRALLAKRCEPKGVHRVFSSAFSLTGSEPLRPEHTGYPAF